MAHASLTTQLRHLSRLLRLRLVAVSLLCWLLFAAVLTLALAVLAHWPVRGNPVPGMLWLAGVALVGAVGWALWRDLRQPRVARVVEEHYPALRESLLTAVELVTAPPPGASPALVQAVVQEAEHALARIPRRSLLDLHRLRPLALAAGLAAALAVSVTVLSRDAIAGMVAGSPELSPPVAGGVQADARPTPAPPPSAISGVRLTLQPPAYTQLPARTLTANLSRVSALPGTRVTLSVAAPVVGAMSLRVNQQGRQLQRAEGRLQYEFTLARDTAWQLQARSGPRSRWLQGTLRVIWDNPPSITVRIPGRDLTLKELKPLRLSAVAADDFGLSDLAFETRLPGERRWRRTALPATGVVQHVEYEWDLSPLKLQPGQSVSYRFEAWDNNPYRGPRSTVSKTYRVTLAQPLPTEGAQQLQQAAEEQRQAVERLREQADDLQKRLESLQEQLNSAEAKQLSPQQAGELQQAAQQLQKQAEELREALAQSEQAVKQSGDALPELSRRLAEINKLMRETLDTKLQEALKQLQQAAAPQQRPQQAAQSLEEARRAQEELMQRLDQLLALLKQAQMEGLLGDLRQQLDALAKQQQALIERREQAAKASDLRAQSPDQQALGAQTKQVEERMQAAAEQAAQQDAKTGEQLQDLARQMRQADVPGLMQQAAQQLQQAQASQAAGPQQAALKQLQQMSGQLAGMQAGVYQQMRRELTQAGAELARRALALSERQEQLLDETGPLGERIPEQLITAKPTLEKLAQRQQLITQGAERLTERLLQLAGKSPLVDPGLVQQAGQVAALAQQAQRDLAGGSMAEAAAGQEQAMTALNRLAAQLMQSQQGFQQASAQMALQEMMRRLEEMARQQQALNQMTQQAGGQPMAGGDQQPGASGQQLAGQQGGIREALQQMLGQAGKQAGMGDQLGGLPQQMDDVEDQLRRDEITQRTFRQQEQILHKMLDAQRSLYNKERESRERIAEAPKPYKAPASPPALRPTQLTPMALQSPGRTHDLPLRYEDLTRRYLEALGRTR